MPPSPCNFNGNGICPISGQTKSMCDNFMDGYCLNSGPIKMLTTDDISIKLDNKQVNIKFKK